MDLRFSAKICVPINFAKGSKDAKQRRFEKYPEPD
jgi:hypothetical protein